MITVTACLIQRSSQCVAGANKAAVGRTSAVFFAVTAIKTHVRDANVVTAVANALAAICHNHGDRLTID